VQKFQLLKLFLCYSVVGTWHPTKKFSFTQHTSKK